MTWVASLSGCHYRGVGADPAGPAVAGPIFKKLTSASGTMVHTSGLRVYAIK